MSHHRIGEMQQFVLRETLRLAVPLHMSEIESLPHDMLTRIASNAATTVGTHGDDLQFGGRHCADTFNYLARGLAAAALTAWGGITFAGLHWCRNPTCPGPDADHERPPGLPEPAIPAPRRPVADVPVAGGVL